MASVLYQSIEALSRDKGIDPQIVVSAVEDAIALATRKYYKTQENMRAELDRAASKMLSRIPAKRKVGFRPLISPCYSAVALKAKPKDKLAAT